MRGNETPEPICIKFDILVHIPGIITGANLGVDRLRGLRLAGVKFCPSPLTLIVVCDLVNGQPDVTDRAW